MCYSFGSPSVESFSYKPNYSTEEKDKIQKLNKEGITWKGKTIKINGTKYIVKADSPDNPNVGDIYDYDAYKSKTAIKIGKTILTNKGKIKFITDL